ncbi:hypothetical protein Q8F55_001471 [Vanrija albida]|uniref:Mid2 domain-containing protein n=1 Tax=Vanrija albida TaxID=181172 RepID=A0ABR3QG56_9TREE
MTALYAVVVAAVAVTHVGAQQQPLNTHLVSMSQTYTHWAPFLNYNGAAWQSTAQGHSIVRQPQGLEGTLTIPFYGLDLSVGGTVEAGASGSPSGVGGGATLELQGTDPVGRVICSTGPGPLDCKPFNRNGPDSYTALFAPPTNGATTTVTEVTVKTQMQADVSVEAGRVPNVVANAVTADGGLNPFFGSGTAGWTVDRANSAVTGTNGATLDLTIPPNVGYIVFTGTYGPQNGQLSISSSPSLPWIPNNGGLQTRTTTDNNFSSPLFATSLDPSQTYRISLRAPSNGVAGLTSVQLFSSTTIPPVLPEEQSSSTQSSSAGSSTSPGSSGSSGTSGSSTGSSSSNGAASTDGSANTTLGKKKSSNIGAIVGGVVGGVVGLLLLALLAFCCLRRRRRGNDSETSGSSAEPLRGTALLPLKEAPDTPSTGYTEKHSESVQPTGNKILSPAGIAAASVVSVATGAGATLGVPHGLNHSNSHSTLRHEGESRDVLEQFPEVPGVAGPGGIVGVVPLRRKGSVGTFGDNESTGNMSRSASHSSLSMPNLAPSVSSHGGHSTPVTTVPLVHPRVPAPAIPASRSTAASISSHSMASSEYGTAEGGYDTAPEDDFAPRAGGIERVTSPLDDNDFDADAEAARLRGPGAAYEDWLRQPPSPGRGAAREWRNSKHQGH